MSASPERKNPYRPGAAVAPAYLAGRTKDLKTFTGVLAAAPELPPAIKLTGLRGVGKTVLLQEYEKRAHAGGWLTSRTQLETRHNTDQRVTDLIVGMCDKAIRKASRTARIRAKVSNAVTTARGALTISYEDLDFRFANVTSDGRSIPEALFAATETAVKQGYAGYLIMLDESQALRDGKEPEDDHPLSLIISAVNSLQESEIPVALVLCGLPTLKTHLLKARSYSERMFRGQELGKLGLPPASSDAVDAFLKPLDGTGVSATDELVNRVVREVDGYPYFIQLWGAELWDAMVDAELNRFDVDLLDQVEPDIYSRLDRDFYDPRVDALTPAEQDLLIATAACAYPPLTSGDIQRASKKSVANVNVLMGRITEQGVVYRRQKGQYEYTAPKFYDYLQRRADRQRVLT